MARDSAERQGRRSTSNDGGRGIPRWAPLLGIIIASGAGLGALAGWMFPKRAVQVAAAPATQAQPQEVPRAAQAPAEPAKPVITEPRPTTVEPPIDVARAALVPTQRALPDTVVSALLPDLVATELQSTLTDFPARQLAGDGSVTWTWETPAEGYAYCPELGRLAIIGAHGDNLAIVDLSDTVREQAAPRLIELTGTPTTVAYKPFGKGGLFIVGHRECDACVLIDAVSLSEVRRIPTESGWPVQIAVASDPASPRGIVMLNTALIAEIDFASQEIVEELNRCRARLIAFSADGATLYAADNSPPREISIFDEQKDLDLANTLSDQFWRQKGEIVLSDEAVSGSFPLPRPGQSGMVALGRQVRDAHLKNVAAELDFIAQAFSSRRPFVAGIVDKEFQVASTENGETVVKVPLPAEWFQQKPDAVKQASTGIEPHYTTTANRTLPRPVEVVCDDIHDIWLVLTAKDVLVIPGQTLGLHAGEQVASSSMPAEAATVGEPYAFQLNDGGRMELVQAPEGMTANAGTLQWTPTSKQVGRHSISARVQRGTSPSDLDWQVTVSHRKLGGDIRIAQASLSGDGRRAVLRGTLKPGTDVPGFDTEVVAVVDLTTGKEVARRIFDMAITGVAMSDADVFVRTAVLTTGPGSTEILRLSAADLKTQQRMTTPAGFLTCVGDRFLRFDGRSETKLYDLTDQVVTFVGSFSGRDEQLHPENGVGSRMADGWIVGDVLWDFTLKTPQLIVARGRPGGAVGSGQRFPAVGKSYPWQYPSQSIFEGYLYDVPVGSQRFEMGAASEFRPVYSSFQPCKYLLKNDRQQGIHLSVEDLITGRPLSEIPLGVESKDASTPLWQIVPGATAILVQYKSDWYSIPIAAIDRVPERLFRIEPKQSTFAVDRSVTEVRYRAEGTRKWECFIPALSEEGRPFRLESTDGVFRIDFGEIAKRLLDVSSKDAARVPGGVRRPDWVDRLQKDFTLVTGKKAEGIPIPVEVTVRAAANDEREALLRHCFLIEVTEAEFLTLMSSFAL